MAVRVFSMSAGLDASTVTPGRTAPVGSVTRPAIVLCAAADRGRKSNAAKTNANSENLSIRISTSL
jgi:hypothetical protein